MLLSCFSVAVRVNISVRTSGRVGVSVMEDGYRYALMATYKVRVARTVYTSYVLPL